MATQAQLDANRENSKLSTGATTEEGQLASSRNNLKHSGLCSEYRAFPSLSCPAKTRKTLLSTSPSVSRINTEPQDATEIILVRRMAEAEWDACSGRLPPNRTALVNEPDNLKKLALYLRYGTTHERSFYKALNELQKLRKEKAKGEIGFESQKLKQAAETRAAEALNVKKDALNLKKEEFEFKKETLQTKKTALAAQPVPETGSGGLEKAA